MKKTATCILISVIMFPPLSKAETTLIVPAQAAQIKTIGGIAGKSWNLCSNGECGDFVRFAKPGVYQVSVLCHGSPAGGIWPKMAFCIDGILRETVTVATNKTAKYTFRLEAEARDYRITVSFLNDAMAQGEDRNLYIASLLIEPLFNEPVPTLTTERAWLPKWTEEQIKQENDTLEKAAGEIEKNRKCNATIRVMDRDGRPAKGVVLVVKLMRHDFLFGCNIYRFDRFSTAGENELYKKRFGELFNYATTGFYWRWYDRERGTPDYAYTDKVVAWCERNHILVKGHPLLWACDSGIPPWAKEQPPAEVRKRRISDIMTRYAGKIEFWEVVNEPAHLLGLEIDDPYRWARNVNPKACLIVNDYQVMADGCPAFFALLQKAQRRGVTFDGIGIQAHEPRTTRFPLEQVWETLDKYATLGKPLHITEFSPTSGGQEITGSHITGKWNEAAQADYAAKFYTVCFAHPAVTAITWWDLSDEGSWLEGGGLLRQNLSPKPAYHALKELIRTRWTTKVEGKTDQDGKFSFRGFRGQYAVQITQNRRTTEQSFHIRGQEHNTINIILEQEPSNKPDADDKK